MKKGIIILSIVLIIIAIGILFLNISVTGKDASDVKEKILKAPRHVFYHSPKFQIDRNFLTSCFPQSEIMPVLLNAKCCDGLMPLTVYDEEQDGCTAPLSGAVLCSDCGNSLCEYGENECNCPQDCNMPPVRL